MLFSSLSIATNFVVSVPCLPIPCKAQKKRPQRRITTIFFCGRVKLTRYQRLWRQFGVRQFTCFNSAPAEAGEIPSARGRGSCGCRPSADKKSITQRVTFVKWFFRSTDAFPGILRMHTPHKAALQIPGTPV